MAIRFFKIVLYSSNRICNSILFILFFSFLLITSQCTGTSCSKSNIQIASDNNEFRSVKEYGALGDGVHNDFEAIVDAVTGNHSVYFPKGIYKCEPVHGKKELRLTKPGQTLALHGSLLLLKGITIRLDASNITIDLEDGILDNGAKYGYVASSGNDHLYADSTYYKLTLKDASAFRVGDRITCGFTYFPQTHDKALSPIGQGDCPDSDCAPRIQKIQDNTVFFKKAIHEGTPLIPNDLNKVFSEGLIVGDFSWGSFISSSKNASNCHINNGQIKNVPGYFCHNKFDEPNAASICFSNIRFEFSGRDQFLFKNTSAKFSGCYFGQIMEAGKSCISFGTGAKIEIDSCKFRKGNFDYEFNASENSKALFDHGSIIVRNSKFDGYNYYMKEIEKKKGPAVKRMEYSGNSLFVVYISGPGFAGKWDKIAFENCTFRNYQRDFILVENLSKSLTIDTVAIYNTTFNNICLAKFMSCNNRNNLLVNSFSVINCDFTKEASRSDGSVNDEPFFWVEPSQVKTSKLINCKLIIKGDLNSLPAEIDNCTFLNCQNLGLFLPDISFHNSTFSNCGIIKGGKNIIYNTGCYFNTTSIQQ